MYNFYLIIWQQQTTNRTIERKTHTHTHINKQWKNVITKVKRSRKILYKIRKYYQRRIQAFMSFFHSRIFDRHCCRHKASSQASTYTLSAVQIYILFANSIFLFLLLLFSYMCIRHNSLFAMRTIVCVRLTYSYEDQMKTERRRRKRRIGEWMQMQKQYFWTTYSNVDDTRLLFV